MFINGVIVGVLTYLGTLLLATAGKPDLSSAVMPCQAMPRSQSCRPAAAAAAAAPGTPPSYASKQHGVMDEP